MGAWGRGSSWHVCGESVPVGAQRPAKIKAVDVVRATQRGWRMVYFCILVGMCPSNCCCVCGWHVKKQAGEQEGLRCFPFSCLPV